MSSNCTGSTDGLCQHFQLSMDQPGTIAKPAREQLYTGKNIFSLPCPRSSLSICTRETVSSILFRVSLLIIHTQAESGACSRDSSRFPGRRPRIPSTAIASVPNLSDHAFAYRWRSLPRILQNMPSSPQGSSSNGCCLFRFHHGPIIYAPLFLHTHYGYNMIQKASGAVGGIRGLVIYFNMQILFTTPLCFCFVSVWCPCMAINVSVQHNGGFLPGIILLTQCYYHRGTRLNAV